MPRLPRVRMTGPLTRFADGFAAALTKQGYRPGPAARQLHLIAHLSRWLAAQGMDAESLTPSVLDDFLSARRAQGYRRWISPRALKPFLGYLQEMEITVAMRAAELKPTERLLADYQTYLVETRGLAESSAQCYLDMVRPFVLRQAVDSGLGWANMSAGDVTAFVRSDCHRRSVPSAQLLLTALRSLLGYLYVEALIDKPLTTVIPAVANSKLAGLPNALEPGEVQRLLAACDRRTNKGRRDFAMLMLLVRLGLRAGEVCTLRLGDIDWRAGTMSVRGKGSRFDQLPLPTDVGEALAGYLRRGRPTVARSRTIFVSVRAPYQPLTSAAVTKAAQAAARRAGLPAVTAHRLRHTVATRMVRAGVPLVEIGQVLRHNRLATTAIYAKVDRESLRCLARQWPGGES